MNTTPPDSVRNHDLVVWGATGYTGHLVALAAAEYLAGRPWAIAGRSRERLETIRDEIAEAGGHAPDIVIADLNDAASMREMTGSTRVVLTTVGPYDHFGEPLIEACIATGTHVADITGEVPWVRRMRSKYESAAREAGVRIVSMCGYDSVPSEARRPTPASDGDRDAWPTRLRDRDGGRPDPRWRERRNHRERVQHDRPRGRTGDPGRTAGCRRTVRRTATVRPDPIRRTMGAPKIPDARNLDGTVLHGRRERLGGTSNA